MTRWIIMFINTVKAFLKMLRFICFLYLVVCDIVTGKRSKLLRCKIPLSKSTKRAGRVQNLDRSDRKRYNARHAE